MTRRKAAALIHPRIASERPRRPRGMQAHPLNPKRGHLTHRRRHPYYHVEPVIPFGDTALWLVIIFTVFIILSWMYGKSPFGV